MNERPSESPFHSTEERRLYRGGNYEASGYDAWMTPPEILEPLIEEFGEMFDPCPTQPLWDGLNIDWPTNQVCFVNPPYSRLSDWCEKCAEQWRLGCTVILIMPPRSCTSYFHDHIVGKAEIRFIRGRVKFIHPDGGKPKGAPFPSILCIFRGQT